MTANPTKFDATALRLSPAFPMECKATAQGVVEGLASPFGGEPDSYGDIIAPGAFSRSLSRHRAERTAPAMLWSHATDRPVGAWDTMEEREDGLHVRGRLALNTEAGREAFEHLRAGSTTGLSIGFSVADGGAERDGWSRVLSDLELHEISLVTLPAARRARVTSVKEIKSRADLRDLLRESGLPRGAAEKLASGGWPALNGDSITETEIKALATELRAVAALF